MGRAAFLNETHGSMHGVCLAKTISAASYPLFCYRNCRRTIRFLEEIHLRPAQELPGAKERAATGADGLEMHSASQTSLLWCALIQHPPPIQHPLPIRRADRRNAPFGRAKSKAPGRRKGGVKDGQT